MVWQVFHVMPTASGWQLIGEGLDSEASVHTDIKDAIQVARSVLKLMGAGQIVIHNEDGSIEEEYS